MLRHDHPQVAAVGVPGGGHPRVDAALQKTKPNEIYTGITRGKRLVVLDEQKKAIAMAVKGKRVRRRWSKLKDRLMG